jgi:hypothetical protein
MVFVSHLKMLPSSMKVGGEWNVQVNVELLIVRAIYEYGHELLVIEGKARKISRAC